ncbi:tetratricopeptide repeat protein [Tenacibaculum maritimum]|uniref:SH3 domain-containing protein n=1 Tax=Tenacibaculum maritimum TaxID=107401 RepID=UPI0012E4D54D|nr:tetratricopeptide repeat protein [Tenacibaculum maritimum]CAA0151516.1 Aerotolerance protein BatE [Tenacibaculum maritimum]
MKKLFFFLCIISQTLLAQSSNELFNNANILYKQGNYEEAIDLYKKIESQKEISSALYYNLGNCYYKLNKVAPTIYNYEKALQLDPLNEDALNNLAFAKRLTLDKIERLPKSFFQRFNKNYLQKLTYDQWAIFSVLFSVLTSLLFFFFFFAQQPSKKRLFFTTSMTSLLLLTITLAISYNQYNFFKSNKEAIIYSEKVAIKNAPTLNSNDVFTLHEGTKVNVLDSVDNWKKIKLADGKIGWITTNDLKEL